MLGTFILEEEQSENPSYNSNETGYLETVTNISALPFIE